MTISQSRVGAIIFAFVLSGCSQEYDNLSNHIPFEIFSLSGTGCEWVELSYPHDNEVIVVDSSEELANYITYPDKSSIPAIDFSQYTLILARGVTPYNDCAAIQDLQQLPMRGYVMNVDLGSSLAAVITNWQVAIITNKLAEDECVQLHVEKSE